MWPDADPVRPRDVTAAAIVTAPWAIALAGLALALPPTSAQAACADPLIQLVRGPWPVVALTLAVLLTWARRVRPTRADLLRAAAWGAAGAVAATAVALALHGVFGDTLPAFIPPEESARPGFTNGVAAGLVEEVVFRFAVLPLAYAAARRRLRVHASIALAALVAGVLFAASHELGPGAGAFELRYFATRFVFPGVVMSLVFLRAHPALMVTAHLAAHVVIPALF
ncbi:MAG: hypothetical protein H6719_21650 [Sandaracinaceae bacterium]|nr:hypothetical protein [Sandaracinaceae bacterium]